MWAFLQRDTAPMASCVDEKKALDCVHGPADSGGLSDRMNADPQAEQRPKAACTDETFTVETHDGALLHVRSVGPCPGTSLRAVVYYIHGLGEHCGARYDHVFARFASEGFRVYAADLRGHGRTAVINGVRDVRLPRRARADVLGHVGASIDDVHADMDALLGLGRDTHGDVPRVLMGHSMGGLFVLSYMMRAAELGATDAEGRSESGAANSRADVESDRNNGGGMYKAAAQAKDMRRMYMPRYAKDIHGVIASAPALARTRPFPRLQLALGRVLQRIAPRLTVDCGLDMLLSTRDPEMIALLQKDTLRHCRVSFGTASMILGRAEELMALVGGMCVEPETSLERPPGARLLVVHGTADMVTCPVASRRFVELAPWAGERTHRVFDNGLHSLHQDVCRDVVLDEYCAWINSLQ